MTKLPLARLILYALPAVPLAALTLPLYIIIPTYYSETLGIPLAAVGAALLVVRIIDAVGDPLIGYVSDRWRPKLGRRRAFFLASLPLTALCAVMLFSPPDGATALYLGIWGALLSVGYTMALLPFSAWGAELAESYHERSRVAGFQQGFTLVGTLIAIALPFAIGMERGNGPDGLAILGWAVAIGLLVLGGLAVWRVPEPKEYTTGKLDLKAGFSHMVRNAPFVRLIVAYFVNGLANGIPATLFLYFVSDRLGATDMRGPLLFLYFMAGVAGVPVALFTARHLGKHRAWCAAMILNCAIFALVPLLGQGDVWAFGAICVTTGILLGFDLSIPPAIQADVIDVDTAESGEQRSGLYFAAWSLATKLSLAVAVGVVFPLLAWFGFQPEQEGSNSASAVSALVAIYVWIPIALKLAAVALMWSFPLDLDAQTELRRRIEERAAA